MIYGQARYLKAIKQYTFPRNLYAAFKRRKSISILTLVVLVVLVAYLGKGQVHGSDLLISEWSEINQRPLPPWFDQSKIGIFVHWGVYSVPGVSSEWFLEQWKIRKYPNVLDYMSKNFKPGFSYQDFGPMFTGEFFDPNQWAEIFEASGAKYVVLTSKHHDGYTLWPSKYSPNWNSLVIGPKRDIVGELAKSVRKREDMRFGLYHSLYEWFHPLYLEDKENRWSTRNFVDNKMMPELKDLINTYRPDVLWSDGEWEAPDYYWNSTTFLKWLYTQSSVKETVVVNDRWGKGTRMTHGGFYSGKDRFNPGVLQKHKWENCLTIDLKSWGFRRTASMKDIMTIEQLLVTMTETVSCGGNILINVGPTPDGRIIPIFEERLRQLGCWLKVNGEAIYKSTPWTTQNDSLAKGVWYTQRPDLKSIYAIVLHWPEDNVLRLGSLTFSPGTTVQMLGVKGLLHANENEVIFPLLTPNKDPSKWAWVLKIEGLER